MEFAHWHAASEGRSIIPEAMFDAQCKRIHEYKRQLLDVLHIAWSHEQLRRTGGLPDAHSDLVARTFLFAGKAAPGYWMAKLIIRLIHGVAEDIEQDRLARQFLRVVFVPDFNVKTAQRIYPAADLSEQISTAGMEASGTGNMKFAMSGALTIGTLDGANVEIRDAVGVDNFFLFGMTADEVAARRATYRPRDVLAGDPELARVIELLESGRFSHGDRSTYAEIVRNLLERDPFFVLADFRSYIECQRRVARAWRDPDTWTRASILNTARTGIFSSDRSIQEYATRIWNVEPVSVAMPER